MKKLSICLIFVLCAGLMAACNTNQKKKEKYNRKIYLTEEDYMEDLSKEAAKERRETAPNIESEYIFNVGPELDKTIYFFDDRQQPKVPGQPSDADYKKEKRLWSKPKRYTPEQYYGMQGSAESSSEESSNSYGYDY
ncbi:hypothetical protein [Candidatus Avelusimicrobium stercoris]|uniref:hypothetical protein n=1 Tax=Candidatus Avelusimicrobium stercoris TaxID=1947924 RepID=UPI003D0CFBC8